MYSIFQLHIRICINRQNLIYFQNVQEFKPFPEGAQPIPLALPLPIEVRNLLEHGNIEGRQRPDGSNEQQEAKPFPGPDDDSEEERSFPVPAEIRNIIHQVKRN